MLRELLNRLKFLVSQRRMLRELEEELEFHRRMQQADGGSAAPRSTAGHAILTSQVALSVILLSGALLLARSLYELRTIDPGFRRDHILVASPDVTKVIPTADRQIEFARRVASRVRMLPGGAVGEPVYLAPRNKRKLAGQICSR